jgi:hypothetical protein
VASERGAEVTRGLLIAAFHTTLSLTDPETAEPVYIFRGVVAPTTLGSTGTRQRSEPLAEPEPVRAYAELLGGLANRECMLLLKHTPTLTLAYRFV